MSNLTYRNIVPERMDDPHLDEIEHRRALAGLRRVNHWCRTGSHIAHAILEVARRNRLANVRVLDLGCGSGDVAMDVSRRIRKSLPCHMTGWDISPVAIKTSTERSNGSNTIHFEQVNVFEKQSPSSNQDRFDVVYCSLFLHHFDEEHAIRVLQTMKQWSNFAVLVDDLLRTRMGLLLATLGCQLLSRSPVVHFDGPQSVRAAWTIEEIRNLSQRAGIDRFQIKTHWPERFLLHCEAPS